MNSGLELDSGDMPGPGNVMNYEHQKHIRRRDSNSEDYPYYKQAGNEETGRQPVEPQIFTSEIRYFA